MPEPVKKQSPLPVLVLLGVAVVAGLLFELLDNHLAGYWLVQYDHGSELLILYADGRYTQQVRIKGGPVYTVRGAWHSENEGGRRWIVQMKDAYDAMDAESCDIADPPRQGERDLRAGREWTSLYMEPCPGDHQHRFERMDESASRVILLK